MIPLWLLIAAGVLLAGGLAFAGLIAFVIIEGGRMAARDRKPWTPPVVGEHEAQP